MSFDRYSAEKVSIYCDASDVGYGGHLTVNSKEESEDNMYGSWSENERAQSSTWRELEKIDRMLKNSKVIIQGKYVQIFSDNKNVPHILNGAEKVIYRK